MASPFGFVMYKRQTGRAITGVMALRCRLAWLMPAPPDTAASVLDHHKLIPQIWFPYYRIIS